MRATKIKIDSLYGIHHIELDGKAVELRGKKGTGKTSVIDAIKLALTNRSARPYIIKDGATAGEIFISTDAGTEISRKKRTDKGDYLAVRDGGVMVGAAQGFLNDIFTPLQLNPVEFASWDEKEQNRAILSLIRFDWDMEWIREQFDEIPTGVDYSQHILSVLEQIQSERGDYFLRRHDLNKEELWKRQTIADVSAKLPRDYDVDYWSSYDLRQKTAELQQMQHDNSVIQRARAFYDSYQNKLRGIEADRDIKLSSEETAINAERVSLEKTVERLKGEIAAAQEKIASLDDKLAQRKAVIIAEAEAQIAKLDGDIKTAEEYKDREVRDCSQLQTELNEAILMKEYVSEYRSMMQMENDRKRLIDESEELTRKIELARKLPGVVLANAELPIRDLTVVDGVPLIKGRPIGNLSSGEKIDLCVDIALAQTDKLDLILLDGAEALDDASREELYARCLDKGVQIIATRTTSDDELVIYELGGTENDA